MGGKTGKTDRQGPKYVGKKKIRTGCAERNERTNSNQQNEALPQNQGQNDK